MTTIEEARRRLRIHAPSARVATTGDSGALSYYLIAGAGLLLVVIGVVMVLSASTITSLRTLGNPYANFISQAQFVLLGLPLLVLASRLPVRWFRYLAWPAFVGSIALQSLVFSSYGVVVNGNRNWFEIPVINERVQPSEFMKIGLALWLGMMVSRRGVRLDNWRHVAPILAGAAVCVALVMLGDDMGTALVLVMLVAGALFVAGLPLWWFGAGAFVGVLGVVALIVAYPSRVRRIMHFLGISEEDPTGTGYQSNHGLWGLGTGGVTGVGLGASREKWAYLPEAHNDFIFAILGEELGLLGTLLVLLLFGVLAFGLLRMIRRHPDPFVKVTTAAVACWVIGQSLVNIGVVIGILPVMGLPLPLVSAGGSAMIATLLALGIMLAFARSEPGARAALSVSTSAVRRSLAVVGGRLTGGRRG
jgi:cell division protein FtsW